MKVLLIEDSPNFAFLVEAMLRSTDQDKVSFIWADNLAKGVYQLQQVPIDVILLDLSLPDSDGLATLTTLKTKAGTTPIIVLTGCNDEQLAIEAMRLGAQDYLLKTEIDKRGLLRALRYAIERQRSEDKYRELVESIDAIVSEADPVTWRFTFVSKAAEKILGYPVEHWLQTPDWRVNLIHPDDRLTTVDYCRRQIEKGGDHEFEYRVIALDGRIVWLRDVVRVIKNEAGRPIALRAIMIDITQSKNAAAELQRHHDEIQSLQEIGQFLLETPDANASIEKALKKAITDFGFDFGDVLLTTPEGQFVSVAAAWGFNDPANRQGTRRRRSGIHRREHLLRSSITHNLQSGERFRSLKQDGAETVASVPLRAGNSSLGLLQLASRKPRDIQPSEMALFEAIGHQFGIAIQKAKLTAELQTNLRRIRALYECNVAVTSTLDLRTVLDNLLEKIDTVPDPGAAITVQLIDRDSGRLEYFAKRNIDEKAWIGEFGSHRNLSDGGLNEHVIGSGTPTVIPDLRTDHRVIHREFFRSQGLFSYLGVQVRIKERPAGIIGIYTHMPYEFGAEEISAITSLAAHAAIAIQNAKLYDEVKRATEKSTVLRKINLAITSSLDLQTQIKVLLDHVWVIFPEYVITLRLANKETGKFDALACRGIDETEWKQITPSIKFGGLAEVLRLKQPVKIADLQTDPRTSERDFLRHNGLTSYLGVPLIVKEETLGVLGFFTQEVKDFNDGEVEFMTTLAEQAAIAIYNARLFTEVEKKSQELAALLDVTASANRSLDMQRVLHDLTKKITQIFDFDATRILLLDDRKENLHLIASYETNEEFASGPRVFKNGQGISGHAAATGVAIVIDNIDTDSRYEQVTHARTALKIGQKFAASFPIEYEDETLGVITCMGRQPRRLTDHELRLIASMSSQVAVAVVNSRYFEQTKEQASQLRQLTAHLETVREQERVRLSRELHDELGQALTGLKFDVAWINGRLSDAQSPLAARLAIMSDSLDNTIDAIRKISTRLRPDILDKLGLSAAIEWQLQEFRQRTGIKFHFDSYLTDIRLSEQHSTALFRILQEALTNVARHSHASRVRIALEIENEEVFLRVADDGGGIDEDKIFDRQSLGLLGMRERAVSLGGNIAIQRNHEQGTIVTAHLPVEYFNETKKFLPRSEEL